MQIRLGEKLREMRRSKGLTQEQVAEMVGVSPQAVSRWENDTAYPDVVMLAGLAMLYDTTADALMGMHELRNENALKEIHTEVLELVKAKRWNAAEKVLRDSLRLYPNNEGLLMALAETLAHSEKTQEAIAVEERVLTSHRLSAKARSTAMVNLLYLYRKAGQWGRAQGMVRELPHIWESREIMLAEVDPQREDAIRKVIHKTLILLCGMIDRRGESKEIPPHVQLGVDFSGPEADGKMLERIGCFLAAGNMV